jgi:hypothetical protein
MKKQTKLLELRKDRVMSLCALKGIKGGITFTCQVNTITGMNPNIMTSVGMVCPTMAQGNTIGC